jgi:peroxiredoxin
MIRRLFARPLALFAGLTLAASLATAADLELGAAMPAADVPLTKLDGQALTLAAAKGEKGTVVVFWCNPCPWVVKWRSRMVELAKSYGQQGFSFVAINSNDPAKSKGDTVEKMKEDAEKYAYSFPYVVDAGAKVATAFGAKHTPHVFVFDASQKLVYVGAIDDNAESADKVTKPYLKNALDALAAGKPIADAQSKSLGCTIKF